MGNATPSTILESPAEAGGAEPSQAPQFLLATKLQPPARRRQLVPRPSLVARLGATPLPRLTLVDAPPGWGKTTLLAEWHAAAGDALAFAWVALDRADNDPVRFWTYVVEALRTVHPEAGSRCLALLRVPRASVADLVLPALINEADAFPAPVVLVLDDYHLVTNPDLHAQVTFLLDHLPERLRLVVATRSDPPLALPRLRAGGDLAEVRVADLRFDTAEAGALLNDLHRLGLSDADVTRLRDRTEGWAAGLYLAALSLRRQTDTHAFVGLFAGDDRHIVDYLGSEVLGAQPDDVRAFLLQTSILDRLCGPLCDAVTQGAGAAVMLEDIERSNLFLVPLDSKREWYRYHHLFGELLRHELARGQPAVVAALHRRAAAWHREHGLVPDAVRHALAAGDHEAAGELIAAHWNDFVNRGQLETVDGWLRLLPDDAIRAHARLCLARAGTSLTLGRRGEVDGWLDAAERRARGGETAPAGDGAERHAGADAPGATSVASEAAIYRAVHRYMLGDVTSAVHAARRAVARERDGTSPWSAMAFAALGRSLYWQGQSTAAGEALQEAVARAQPPRNNLSVIGALGYLAALRAEAGDPDEALALAEEAVRRGDAEGLGEHWVTVTALVARSKAQQLRGELAGAEASAARAVQLARRGAGAVETADSLVALAGVRHHLGDTAGAGMLLAEARSVAEPCPDPGILDGRLARLSAALDTAAGHRAVGARAQGRAGEGGPLVVEELSERELAVLRLLPSPLSRREIGATLHVSPNTVKTQTSAIYRKLAASTRAEAVARARDAGLL